MTFRIPPAVGGVPASLTFLTRIPCGHSSWSSAEHGWAPAHFPLIGALLGLIGCAVWLVTAPFSEEVRAWCVIATSLLVTGAFHEDGLADTADALGGAYTRERLFTILKDSRIGSFGAAALVIALSLRAALLVEVVPASLGALVVAQSASRLPPVVMMRVLPYVTPSDGSRSRDIVGVGIRQILVATLWTLLVGMLVQWASPIPLKRWGAALALLSASSVYLAFRFRFRAGGITGDFLGATQQIGELAFLLGLAL